MILCDPEMNGFIYFYREFGLLYLFIVTLTGCPETWLSFIGMPTGCRMPWLLLCSGYFTFSLPRLPDGRMAWLCFIIMPTG
jgi:hypothetical protein